MPGTPLTPQEEQLEKSRSRWDPWDDYDCFQHDGDYMRLRGGGGLSEVQASETLEELIQNGTLDALPHATDSSTDVVYFLQRESGGSVKVGHTTMKGLNKRIQQIQNGNDESLAIRGLYEGGVWLEAALHQLFAASRRRGEWFSVTPTLRRVCPSVIG